MHSHRADNRSGVDYRFIRDDYNIEHWKYISVEILMASLRAEEYARYEESGVSIFLPRVQEKW